MNRIIINLKGGLGNQLFQLAAGIYFAEMQGTNEIYLYTGSLSQFRTKRFFGLMPFTSSLVLNVHIIERKTLFYNEYVLKLASFFFRKNIVNEENFFLNRASGTIIINGYFQRSEFIPFHIIAKIKESFKAYIDSNSFFTEVHKKMISLNGIRLMDDSLGVHIRGTDFLNNGLYCNTNPYETFKRAKFNEDDKIFVFTDDKEYAKRKLRDFKCELIFLSEYIDEEIIEFYIMSKFKNFIIANSTFSLSAIIIGMEEYKCIWAPSKWVNDYDKNKDLLNICKLYGIQY